MYLILILLSVILWWWWNSHIIDHLVNFVPFNAFIIPNNEINTEVSSNLFSTTSVPFDKTSFQMYPFPNFPYQQQFIDKLNTLLKSIQKIDKKNGIDGLIIDRVRGMYNVYWKDTQNDSRQFVFNVDITDNKTPPKPLRVVLTMYNIKKYITDNGTFDQLQELQKSDVQIYSVSFEDADLNPVSFVPIEDTIPYNNDKMFSFYRTKNTLYLWDPFLTNRNV